MHTRNRKSMGIKVLNLLAAGLLVAALVLGCNTNVSNGGEVQPPTPPVYTPVAYADLPNHLTTAQPETNGIYYIEVTGLTAPDVKGNILSDSESPLGKILKKNKKKKVALKFGTISYGVTDMTKCFEGCTNLVQVSNIPDSITDMYGCFRGCTKLEQVSNIPNSVKDMSFCFGGCTKLERVPNLPNSVKDMNYCFYGCTSLISVTLKCGYLDGKFNYAFYDCSSLSAGSIKVPADSLDEYKSNARQMGAKAELFAKDE